MTWQIIWFAINLLFVAALITTLFMHRFVATAKLEGNPEKVKRMTTLRNWFALLSAIFFIGMCISFLTNMRLNG